MMRARSAGPREKRNAKRARQNKKRKSRRAKKKRRPTPALLNNIDKPASSISRNRRIHLPRPCIDAALQIEHILMAARFEEHRDLRAARTVMADANDGRFVVEFLAARRDLAHRNRHTVGD